MRFSILTFLFFPVFGWAQQVPADSSEIARDLFGKRDYISLDIRFELARWELAREDSTGKLLAPTADEIARWVLFLEQYPNTLIEIGVHSDNRVNPRSSRVLSQKRAKTLADHLIEKGVNPQRVIPVGYENTQLRVADSEIAKLPTVEEREAAHRLNRRVTLRLLRDDFYPEND